MKERRNKWFWLMFLAWGVTPFIAWVIVDHFRVNWGLLTFGLMVLEAIVFANLDFNLNREFYLEKDKDASHMN